MGRGTNPDDWTSQISATIVGFGKIPPEDRSTLERNPVPNFHAIKTCEAVAGAILRDNPFLKTEEPKLRECLAAKLQDKAASHDGMERCTSRSQRRGSRRLGSDRERRREGLPSPVASGVSHLLNLKLEFNSSEPWPWGRGGAHTLRPPIYYSR